MSEEASAQELLRKSFATFNTGDLDACVELLTEDFVANVAGSPAPEVGRAAWRHNAEMFRASFPDLTAEIQDIFGSGDRVALRLIFRGTHSAPFFGMPATGRIVQFSSIELYRVADGLIAEEWVAPDVTSLIGQLSGQ